jgi:hypothetical protein
MIREMFDKPAQCLGYDTGTIGRHVDIKGSPRPAKRSAFRGQCLTGDLITRLVCPCQFDPF